MGPQLYRCGNPQIENARLGHALASMGPQLYRCGNTSSSPANTASIMCFNGAATLSLRKPTRSSCGCRGDRCFNGAATLSLRKRTHRITCNAHCLAIWRHASMGPQLYRCGNVRRRTLCVTWIYASMGPQLYRCGNPTLKRHLYTPHGQLQWGRNFIVAETAPWGR